MAAVGARLETGIRVNVAQLIGQLQALPPDAAVYYQGEVPTYCHDPDAYPAAWPLSSARLDEGGDVVLESPRGQAALGISPAAETR